MINLLKFAFGLIGSILAIYILITKTYNLLPLMSFFMGLMLFMMGIFDFKENRKITGYTLFLASGFVIFVAVYTFIT
ncbi:DUF3953 domain-containing protein [Bacillus bombysepticus]